MASSDWYRWLARIGLVAKGVSFGIVGVLAINLAFGEGDVRRAAKAHSRRSPRTGTVLLALLALGFAAYALWRFVQAYAERGGAESDDEAKTWGKRAGNVGRGLVYVGLTFGTINANDEFLQRFRNART